MPRVSPHGDVLDNKFVPEAHAASFAQAAQSLGGRVMKLNLQWKGMQGMVASTRTTYRCCIQAAGVMHSAQSSDTVLDKVLFQFT